MAGGTPLWASQPPHLPGQRRGTVNLSSGAPGMSGWLNEVPGNGEAAQAGEARRDAEPHPEGEAISGKDARICPVISRSRRFKELQGANFDRFGHYCGAR